MVLYLSQLQLPPVRPFYINLFFLNVVRCVAIYAIKDKIMLIDFDKVVLPGVKAEDEAMLSTLPPTEIRL